MTDLRTGLLAARELGPESLFHYARYRIALASGWIRRRTPPSAWDQRPLADCVRDGVPGEPEKYAAYRQADPGLHFFFDAGAAGLPWEAGGAAPRDLLEEADEIAGGRFRLFGGPPIDLGIEPDWQAAPSPPERGIRSPGEAHWAEVSFDRPGRDVRLVWELSRFGWLITLARAYRWTGKTGYAEAAWGLLESWRRANPPNRGVHWTSAQEVGLRILALGFAERAFLPAWRTNPERLAGLVRTVMIHADRIVPTLDYARAQDNNHLLSEGAGLLTAALLFPELRGSRRWLRLGRKALERGFARQVLADGGYVQHSANYHRLALILGVWCARLAHLSGKSFSESLGAAVGRLARGLAAQLDPTVGRMAAFGPDDSSLVLRLSPGAPDDARPELEAAARLTLGESWFGEGPWEETARWLGVQPGRPAEPPQPPGLPEAGLHFLRGQDTRGTLRCVRFRGRPGHSDQLHLDLWWRERPIAFDPGSFLYNGPPPFEGGLAEAAVHNSPVFDGREPMRRFGRFLWVDRAQGRITGRWERDGLTAVRGEHDGYRHLGHRMVRTVGLIEGRAWLVADEVSGDGDGSMTVGWNLPEAEWNWEVGQLTLALPAGRLSVRWDGAAVRAGLARAGTWVAGDTIAGPHSVWGWRAPHYGRIEPCLRLVVEAGGRLPLRVRTGFLPGEELSEPFDRLWQGRAPFPPKADR